MSLYRIYFFSSDSHIKNAENVECANDGDVLAVAAEKLKNHPIVEVWDQARIVGRLEGWAAE